MRHFISIMLLLAVFLPFPLGAQTPEQSAAVRDSWIANDTQGLISICREVLGSEPDNDYMMYTIAYAFAKENEPDSSLVWMKRSIDHGNTDYKEFLHNDEFEAVRALPGFYDVIRLGRERALEENRRKAIELRTGEWTTVKLESEREYPQVEFSLNFDEHNLYLKSIVRDIHFKDGNRAWRYGDGFFINLVLPQSADSVYSDRFFAYGFAREDGKPICTLVNAHGRYFLAHLDAIAPNINIDKQNNRAGYDMTIPWEYLYPFHPLMDEEAGINIIYTSQNDNNTRRRVKYVPDLQFDSEGTKLRRYATLSFAQSAASVSHVAGRLESRLIDGESGSVELAVWAPEGDTGEISGEFLITIKDEAETMAKESRFKRELHPGRNIIQRDIVPPDKPGLYTVEVELDGMSQWKDSFYRFDRAELERLKSDIARLAEDAPDALLAHSADALTYLFTELERSIDEFTEYDDVQTVKRMIDRMTGLCEKTVENGSIYTKSGYILSAFRSPRDGSLQPFSIVLPEGFDPRKSYNLLIGLHGSGVHEIGFIRYMAQLFSETGYIIVGPRGRDLSAWYLGESELDTADLTGIVKKLFNVKNTLVGGFSMGGYGVWRMSFLHPELFDGAICVSGSPHPPVENIPENDMRNHIGKGRDLQYLVIHGTEDRAVEIDATDDFMAKLKEAGYDLEYIRVEGGGHGDFDLNDRVMQWLEERFGD